MGSLVRRLTSTIKEVAKVAEALRDRIVARREDY
jgi:hypothetical protein